MGASSSKTAAAAGRGAVSRKFPSRAPGSAIPPSVQQARPGPPSSGDARDKAVASPDDSADPDSAPGGFSQRLHSMGIAQPNPSFSPPSRAAPSQPPSASSAPVFPAAGSNTTLSVLEARRLLDQQAADELENMGRHDSQGRRFLDVRTVVDAIGMRERGTPSAVIEERLRLERGLMDKLGTQKMLSHVSR